MSNSIWKTPEENPDMNKGFACYKSNLSLVENNRYLQNGAVKPDREWGYVKEIIAKADKAERLEKENEAMREEFEVWQGNYKCEVEDKERLRKVVFFLIGHLRDVLQLDEYGHIKLDEITKQQIKTAISDPVGIIMQLEQESNN